MLAEFINLAKS